MSFKIRLLFNDFFCFIFFNTYMKSNLSKFVIMRRYNYENCFDIHNVKNQALFCATFVIFHNLNKMYCVSKNVK